MKIGVSELEGNVTLLSRRGFSVCPHTRTTWGIEVRVSGQTSFLMSGFVLRPVPHARSRDVVRCCGQKTSPEHRHLSSNPYHTLSPKLWYGSVDKRPCPTCCFVQKSVPHGPPWSGFLDKRCVRERTCPQARTTPSVSGTGLRTNATVTARLALAKYIC